MIGPSKVVSRLLVVLLLVVAGMAACPAQSDPRADGRNDLAAAHALSKAYWDMYSDVKNGTQAPWLSTDPAWATADGERAALEAGAGPELVNAMNLGSGWPLLQEARAKVLEARVTFDQARRTPGRAGSALVAAGNELLQAAKKILDVAVKIWEAGRQALWAVQSAGRGRAGRGTGEGQRTGRPGPADPDRTAPGTGRGDAGGGNPAGDGSGGPGNPGDARGGLGGDPGAHGSYLPADQRRALMQLAARMDRIATEAQNGTGEAVDHFFQGAASYVRKTLQFLAQPRGGFGQPGVPLQSILAYFTNDYRENDEKLWQSAVEAVDQLERDPARFWGEQAPNLIPIGGAASEVQTAARAQQAARRMIQVSEEAGAFRRFEGATAGARPPADGAWGTTPGTSLPGVRPSPNPGSRPPVNPFFGTNNCVDVALAQDAAWETGRPYIALPTRPGPGGVPEVGGRQWPDIIQTLRRKYGASPTDPLHGPTGLIDARQGVPVPSSPGQVEVALQSAGPGSRGIVFIERANGTRHAVNVRNQGGTVEFWDAQVDQPASRANVVHTSFYRTR